MLEPLQHEAFSRSRFIANLASNHTPERISADTPPLDQVEVEWREPRPSLSIEIWGFLFLATSHWSRLITFRFRCRCNNLWYRGWFICHLENETASSNGTLLDCVMGEQFNSFDEGTLWDTPRWWKKRSLVEFQWKYVVVSKETCNSTHVDGICMKVRWTFFYHNAPIYRRMELQFYNHLLRLKGSIATFDMFGATRDIFLWKLAIVKETNKTNTIMTELEGVHGQNKTINIK